MTNIDKPHPWRDAAEKFTSAANEQIFSVYMLQRSLEQLIRMDSSPLSGIKVIIKQHHVEHEIFVGTIADKQLSTQIEPLGEDGAIPGGLEVLAWSSSGSVVSTSTWYQPVKDLVLAAWRAELREGDFGLLKFKAELVKSRLPRTIRRLVGEMGDANLYVVYIDLDRFKIINDQLGHAVGDDAIRHVAQCIEQISKNKPIFGFRNGGDEFCLIVAGMPIAALVEDLWLLNEMIAAKEFGTEKYSVGFTAGIAPLNDFETFSQFESSLSSAESVTKNPENQNNKKRGTVSIVSYSNSTKTQLSPLLFMKFGVLLARTFQVDKAPFANIYLNLLSRIVCNSVVSENSLESLSSKIDQATSFFGVQVSDGLTEDSLVGIENSSTDLSLAAIAIAIYHGIARAQGERTNPEKGQFSLRLSQCLMKAGLFQEDLLIWGDVNCTGFEVPIGSPIITLAPCAYATAIAFQVGFKNTVFLPSGSDLPQKLFIDTVVVDDRPKTGGGLPDFWQAGVANLISVVGNNSNFQNLVVIGNPENAPETIKRIKGEISINSGELSVVTALSRETVDHSLDALRCSGAMLFANDFEKIIDILYEASLRLKTWQTKEPEISRERPPKLKRKLDAEGLTLGTIDGVRCDSAAQAYPLVVEIMRTSNLVATTYDDASQTLREIVGFKLVLENPIQDPIPDYWADQKDAFEGYAGSVLINSDSFISKKFHDDGQFVAFISQLADYCDPKNSRKSTRRAILVVENIVHDNQLRPLGLVSIWATPRHHDGICSIEFCFSWRTVETLVGLPYSLFGSIRFSEFVIKNVGDLHKEMGIDVRVELGKLTYLALSLHMRVDEFHRRIAKQIADAASV
ncbi:diguanylate cyclase [Undibacterium amnicola]|uniref:diguanylate cyclase n=1 Tax=Undibacterium amnicola TaxID=1834038 RepID=A0ABR6XSK0_9BURK|nr:GGDEF domain-containing protein [Undibacterium amnicola]MBC3832416.1 diguanylate cyclase [Undibacterium amnicola]